MTGPPEAHSFSHSPGMGYFRHGAFFLAFHSPQLKNKTMYCADFIVVCVYVCVIGEQNERYTPKQRLEMSGKSSASLRSRHLYRRDEASPYMSEADPVSACTYIPLHLFFCLWLWDHSERKLCFFRSSDSYRQDFLMMCLCLTALDAKWATNVILMMP